MRALVTIAFAALVVAVPAAAQDKAEATQSASGEAKPAEAKKAGKQEEKKICRRLANGKVCMTEKKWRQYDAMM